MIPGLTLAASLLAASTDGCFLVSNKRIEIIPCNFEPNAIAARLARMDDQPPPGASRGSGQAGAAQQASVSQGAASQPANAPQQAGASQGGTSQQLGAAQVRLQAREPPVRDSSGRSQAREQSQGGGLQAAVVPAPAQPQGGAAPSAGAAQTGMAQTGTAQTGAAQTGIAQTGIAQTETAQTGTAQTGTAQTGTAQTGTAQTGAAQTGAASPQPQIGVPPVMPQGSGSPRPLDTTLAELRGLDAALATGSVGDAAAVLDRAAQAFASANSPRGASLINAAQSALARNDLFSVRQAIAGAMRVAATP